MAALRISDHALVRYIERAGGCDLEVIREQLSASLAKAHAAARAMGDTDYLIKMGGAVFVVRGDVMTTVLEERAPDARYRALDRQS